MGQTYSYALLDVSPQTYDEIRQKLDAADYDFCIKNKGRTDERIDMAGLALTRGD